MHNRISFPKPENIKNQFSYTLARAFLGNYILLFFKGDSFRLILNYFPLFNPLDLIVWAILNWAPDLFFYTEIKSNFSGEFKCNEKPVDLINGEHYPYYLSLELRDIF